MSAFEPTSSGPRPGAPPPRPPSLDAAPRQLVDPATGVPRVGRFQGHIGELNLEDDGAGFLAHRLRAKRWTYLGVVHPKIHATVIVVDAGYMSGASVACYHRGSGRIAERFPKVPSRLPLVRFGSLKSGVTSFQIPGMHASMRADQGGRRFAVLAHTELDGDPFTLDVRAMTDPNAHPPLALVQGMASGGFLHTTKHAALPLVGHVRWGNAEVEFLPGEGFGIVDLSVGYPPPDTFWNWLAAAGRAKTGETVGVNISTGIYTQGPGENALFLEGRIVPLGPCHFEYDPGAPDTPWKIISADGTVRLTLSPERVRTDRMNLVVVRSSFIQPIGPVTGTIEFDDRTIEVELFGTAEEHRARW